MIVLLTLDSQQLAYGSRSNKISTRRSIIKKKHPRNLAEKSSETNPPNCKEKFIK